MTTPDTPTEPDHPIRVLIVDDDPLVRSALELMLGGHTAIELVGTATDGNDGVTRARELRPDVVLMDIRMPGCSGLEAAEQLGADPTPPHVIMLTTFDADEHVLGAIAAGAEGFLLKDTPPAEIVAAIERVASGDPMFSPSATRVLMGRLRDRDASNDDRAAAATKRLAELTPREHDVAVAVGRGLANSDIAAELFMSVPTVKAHLSKVFDKLGVANRVQIAICVHEAGAIADAP